MQILLSINNFPYKCMFLFPPRLDQLRGEEFLKVISSLVPGEGQFLPKIGLGGDGGSTFD